MANSPFVQMAETYGNTQVIKNSLSEINTASPIFLIDTTIDGVKHGIYHVNLIKLLDKMFMNDDFDFISKKQEQFLERYIFQANTVTNQLNLNSTSDSFAGMDKALKEFDNVLGSYYGEYNGRHIG